MCYGWVVPLISAAVSGYSSYQQGVQKREEMNYQADLMNYQAKVDENNAQGARYQAENAQRLGEIELEELKQRQAQYQAQGEVSFANAGVELGSGSPLTWSMDVAEAGARDIEMSKYNTAMEVYGLKEQERSFVNQAMLDRSQGANYRRTGRNAYRSSVLEAAGTVAGGALSAYSGWSAGRTQTNSSAFGSNSQQAWNNLGRGGVGGYR